jgi:sulfide:quinone oxidoreductase
MNIKKMSTKLFVSEQISPGEMGIAAAQGIKTIINNRPDNETPDQPETQAIIDAAAAHGIEFVHIPVVGGAISELSIDEFCSACENANGPVLAYCRSGMRSTMLWALVEARTLDVNTIMATARKVGYDLAALRPRLEATAAEPTE